METRQGSSDTLVSHLALALNNDDPAPMRAYLEGGGDPNAKNTQGNNLLALAMMKDRDWAVDLLIQYHADLEMTDSFGDTPLIRATAWNNDALVLKLLDAGAKIDGINKGMDTPLSLALRNGRVGITKLLLARMPHPPEDRTPDGNPIWESVTHPQILALLIEHGMGLQTSNMQGQSLLHHLVKNGMDTLPAVMAQVPMWVDLPDLDGNTALMLAAMTANHTACRQLLALGANARLTNQEGEDAWRLVDVAQATRGEEDVAITREVLALERKTHLSQVARAKPAERKRQKPL
jgi:ankyrin repeat protein